MSAIRGMPRAAWAVLLAVALLVTTAVVLFTWEPSPRHTNPSATPKSPAAAPTESQPTTTPGTAAAVDMLEQDLQGLRAVRLIGVANPPAPITGTAATQPDLYAGEFVRRLLTQEYVSPRNDFLAWVQADSAQSSEPLVVGLVPTELRDRLAIYSVTTSTDGGARPIPNPEEWAALAQSRSYTTVQVDRVREPVPWANAVLAGRISDPGCTAREVLATVTRHQGDSMEKASVAVTMVLEGPPSRSTWGFVKLVRYTSIPMGAS